MRDEDHVIEDELQKFAAAFYALNRLTDERAGESLGFGRTTNDSRQ
jgi:hypothetical protein